MYDEDALTPESLGAFKKELITALKDFEKKYVKHVKATNPFLADIHKRAMQPVVDLTESSANLQNFRNLSQKREYPEFRKKALVEKFIEHMENVCKILRAFPNKDGKTLDQEYNIRHIMELLDLEWQSVPPFAFYMNPMQEAYDSLVSELREMHKKGPLRMSYYVERNYEMTKRIYKLVEHYNIVKILMGDKLRRDQFKFIFNVHEMIYTTALKDIYLDPSNH